ncbi:GNAT family N-acetyltransferase [Metarhizobium album]|nr:GNAT family N-acetyltransferase [Rhizobium album]
MGSQESTMPAAPQGASGPTLPMIVEVHHRMEPLEREWRSLERNNGNSLHQGYDWCAAWIKTHDTQPAIVRATDGDKTLFILPLEIVRHNMVRTAQFIAGRFSNINTGLFSPEFRSLTDEITMRSIGGRLIESLRDKADIVTLRNVPLLWRDEPHPFRYLPSIVNQNHAFQLPLLETFTATIAQLNAKRRRKKFRSQVKRLEVSGGFDHIVARTPVERSALMELFFQQKAVRFKALGLPNVFHAPETQAFFHLLLETDGGGRDTPLQLHAIRLKGEHEGKIAAIAGLSRKGDHIICQFGSIDESVAAEASPGELLFWLMIEQACAEDATLFDFGIGDQGYKRSWCPVETVQHDILLPISAVGRFAVVAQRGVTRTKAAIKGNPRVYALLQRLRAKTGPSESTDD